MKKQQRKNAEKALAYWETVPHEQWDQNIGNIKFRSRKPCGCFGVHMARAFRITHVFSVTMPWGETMKQTWWKYNDFTPRMRDLLGITQADLTRHGASSRPFSHYRWPRHPGEVLRSILAEK